MARRARDGKVMTFQRTPMNTPRFAILVRVASLVAYILAGVANPSHAQEKSAKEATRETAKEVGHTVGTAVREVGQGAKKATKEVGKAVTEVARETGHAFRDGAKEFKQAVHGQDQPQKDSTQKNPTQKDQTKK
jgi:hypothetical protein